MRAAAGARRAAVLAFALGASLVVGGCEYLYGYGAGGPDDFALPTPVATYRTGSATLTLGDDAPIELGTVNDGALYDDFMGGEAVWSNGEGWYLRAIGVTEGGVFGSFSYLTIDRIVGVEHWTTSDPTRCVLTIESADATGLRGTASCRGLRWADAMSSYGMGPEPRYVPGEDEFDAEIRFEALPETTSPA
jgi:hypothetical protein